jgi:predicted Zn-dependent peptidase
MAAGQRTDPPGNAPLKRPESTFLQRDLQAISKDSIKGRLTAPRFLASAVRPLPFSALATITTSTLANGLPVHRVSVDGTRATTILVAFDAGARTERPEENGMAHFLEHLVFKGGEKFPTYRDVNAAAEGIGAVLNAYTSHDLVAFHITARAERALQAADLLTDFVARARIDADELERERGVVVQEIARANDQPAAIAGQLIDEAAFGEHPLGRSVLGPEEHLRDTFTREGILAFRARRWSPARGAAFLVGNLETLPPGDGADELFGRFSPQPEPEAYEPAPPLLPRVLVRERDSSQSHLRMSYRPAIEVTDPKQRTALAIYSTLLGGSMGSRLFDEIREQRGLAYAVHAAGHSYADVPILQLSAGLQSDKCIEALRRMREIVSELREQGPTEEEVDRARAFAAGARTIAFENSGAVARYAAQQVIVHGEEVDPDRSLALLDATTFDEVREVAHNISDELAIACVGPHSAQELEAA